MVRLYLFYDVPPFSFFYIYIYIYAQVVKFPSIRLFRYFSFPSLCNCFDSPRSVDLRCSPRTKNSDTLPLKHVKTPRCQRSDRMDIQLFLFPAVAPFQFLRIPSNIDQFLTERSNVNAIGTRPPGSRVFPRVARQGKQISFAIIFFFFPSFLERRYFR